MPNWYLYYRIMHSIPENKPARVLIQDVLVDLRGKASKEWPRANSQEIQDFFGELAWQMRFNDGHTQAQLLRLIRLEPWGEEDAVDA